MCSAATDPLGHVPIAVGVVSVLSVVVVVAVMVGVGGWWVLLR